MTTEYLNNKIFEIVIAKFQKSKRDKLKYNFILEDIKEVAARKPEDHISHQLLKEILELYKKAEEEYLETQKQLAESFLILSRNLVHYANLPLVDADDAVQEGVMICFEKIDRFDPSKGRAFNYATTVALNHMRQLFRSARNYNELKNKYLNHIQEQLYQTLQKYRVKSKKIINDN